MSPNLLYKISFIILALFCFSCTRQDNYTTITIPTDAGNLETLAAQEVRRYVYLRTGQVLSIIKSDTITSGADIILIAKKDRHLIGKTNNGFLKETASKLAGSEFILKTISYNNDKLTVLCGGDAIGTLYAAYQLAEKLGVRFYLHGDVIPDRTIQLQLDLDEMHTPLFEIRGIQPFHDFPEGPDWWNMDNYKAILSQLPKMKMNFIGLHTYPEGGVGPEPTVWIGGKNDLLENGNVKFAYPARHFTTLNGTWGYQPKKTGDYYYGMESLFERDAYGTGYMEGMAPWPQDLTVCDNLFNRTGNFFNDVFSYAKIFGIKTCVGTETPLVVPKEVKNRLVDTAGKQRLQKTTQDLYEGMFQWIVKNYPIDYYWFWTPENWTWGGNTEEDIKNTEDDVAAAIKAAAAVQAPFTLATCGWVLGPKIDRTLFDNFLPKNLPMSSINRRVGFAPLDINYARIKDRLKWAIPWLEDDPGMIIPQLWAGRMRRDAADALAYGCTGLIGIHWRTRILGPNISALAKAAWHQEKWNPNFNQPFDPPDYRHLEGSPGALFTTFTDTTIGETEANHVFKTLIYSMDNYYLNLENGIYDLTLQFLEVHFKSRRKRLFGIKIQDQMALDTLDIFDLVGYGRPLNLSFKNIAVEDERLHIHFKRYSDNPILAGIVIMRHSQDHSQQQVVRKINCAGRQHSDYEADPNLALHGYDRPRDLSVEDFYLDWAKTQFGENVSAPLAKIFGELDGSSKVNDFGSRLANLPRPANWRNGPGGLFADSRSWEQVRKEYLFVDEIERLRDKIEGKGNLERFDYWLNNFRYLRAIGQFICTLNEYDLAMKNVRNEKNSQEKKRKVSEDVIPIRIRQLEQIREIHKYLSATVKTTGAMGVVANWQQHNIAMHIEDPGKELEQILDDNLPEQASLSKAYPGDSQLIIPAVRTCLLAGEALRLKVILLGAKSDVAQLYWKALGDQTYQQLPLHNVLRGVYQVIIPPESISQDFEYYVQVKTDKKETLVFPATAPTMNQTVVVLQ